MPNETNDNSQSRAEFDAIVRKANAGDQQAILDLRGYLVAHPEIWHAVGDLVRHAEEALIRLIARENQLLAESLRRKGQELRDQLAGSHELPLERLVVERVVAAWFELQFASIKYPADHGKSVALARFICQYKESAQRRFDAAMKSLVLIREKLPLLRKAELRVVRPKRKIIVSLPARAV